MKRMYKSGAQKRKEAASSRQSAAKLTKLTRFFFRLHKQIGQVKTTLLRMQQDNNIRNLFYQPQLIRKILTSLSKSDSLVLHQLLIWKRQTKVLDLLALRQKQQIYFYSATFIQSSFERPSLLAKFYIKCTAMWHRQKRISRSWHKFSLKCCKTKIFDISVQASYEQWRNCP